MYCRAQQIAEVKSRFEDESIGGIKGFIKLVSSMGFEIKKVDQRNKMFCLFGFTKAKSSSAKTASSLPALKPCVYKKR